MNDLNDSKQQQLRPVNTDSLFWGILLLGMGIVFLLERLHVANVHDVLRNYWPLFLVAIGVSKLFKPGAVWGGLTLIGIAVWFELVTLHVYDLSWETSWPLLLIIIGGLMVLRALFEGARRSRRSGSPDSSTDSSPDVSGEARHDG